MGKVLALTMLRRDLTKGAILLLDRSRNNCPIFQWRSFQLRQIVHRKLEAYATYFSNGA